MTDVSTIVAQRGERYRAECRDYATREAILLYRLHGNQCVANTFAYGFFDDAEARLTPRKSRSTRYVMILEEELVPLRQYLKTRGGDVDEAMLIRLMADMATALKGIHGHKACHRDLKLDNMYWRERDGRFVLADLGTTSLLGHGTGATAFVPERESSKAPELCNPALLGGRKEPPPSCDLYGLGSVVKKIGQSRQICFSSSLQSILDALCEPDWRKRRFGSADQLLEALRPMRSVPDPGGRPDHGTVLSEKHRAEAATRVYRPAPAGGPGEQELARVKANIREGNYAEAERLLRQPGPAYQPLRNYLCLLQNRPVSRAPGRDPRAVLVNTLGDAVRSGKLPEPADFLAAAKELPNSRLRGALYYYAGRSVAEQSRLRRDRALRARARELFLATQKCGFGPASDALKILEGQKVDRQSYRRRRREDTAQALWPD